MRHQISHPLTVFMRCYVYLAMSLQHLNIPEGSFNVTCPSLTFCFLPDLIDNLKHSPDEERAAPETLTSIQSSSQYVYKVTSPEKLKTIQIPYGFQRCAGDSFWEKVEFTARVCFQISNSAWRQFNLIYM